jgi:SAM-dependent methyltransferase
MAMRTLGRLSRGISIGWRYGFDSGESLDHVYGNQSRGSSLLGRLIDRCYLSSVGWKGIRQRKVHLERALEEAVRLAHKEGRPLRVVDIASGPGRYLLETAQRLRNLPLNFLCRDRSTSGLTAGRKLADQLGIQNMAYEEGDAFDRESLARLDPQPTIAIASGLYELFPDNAPVRESIAGVHAALPPGGWFIYTNQPWHPQVEMIARVLPNREGVPWIMRRRTQAEMDELVRAAGFEKCGMEIDRWGIFTVSVARKISGK